MNKRLLLPLLLLALAMLACARQTPVDTATPLPTPFSRPGTELQTVIHDGLDRTYRIYIPTSVNATTRVPLVFVLHGGGGNSRQTMNYTDFNALADQHGFIVVYPDAVDDNWNDGRIFSGNSADDQPTADDIGYLSALRADLIATYPIDSQRVFATGISNGGHLALRVACDLADEFLGIAAVTANQPAALTCEPSQPISVLVMNGTADPLVPYDGGAVANNRGEDLSTAETIAIWRNANTCDPIPTTTALPDSDPTDGTTTTVDTYSNCANSTQLILYTINGGGHTWPGKSQYLPIALIGPTARDFDGSEVIWAFFAALTPHAP